MLISALKYWHYVIRRLLLLIVVIWGTVTITFIIARILPANPVALYVGQAQITDPKVIAQITHEWGLDQPLYIQYLAYFKNILTGNLGNSFSSQQPVINDLQTRMPATIELSIFALIFTLLIAIPVGIVSATHKNSLFDHGGRIFSIAGFSAPSFWIAIMLLLIFYRELGFVGPGRLSPEFTPPPFVTGMYTIDALIAGNLPVFFNALEHLVLPGLTLGLGGSAVTMRLLRSSMLEAINSDYIRTARMKGLRERVVIYRHAFRNALIPMTTYVGLLIGGFLSGAVLTETIFSWNGMGQYTVNAIFASDFPALQGVVLFEAFIFAGANLIVDLAYGIIDPRVRYG